jgi:hypothetical protein
MVRATQTGSDRGGSDRGMTVAADGETTTVHIPLTFRKPDGRNLW